MKRMFAVFAALAAMMMVVAPSRAQLPPMPPEPIPPGCQDLPIPNVQCTLEVWLDYLSNFDEATLTAFDEWWVQQGLPDVPLEPSTLPFTQTPGDAQQDAPLRGAFYYPWYPENWGGVSFPQSRFKPVGTEPTGGYYNTVDALPRHIDDLVYGRFDVGISSWYKCLPEGVQVQCNPPGGDYRDPPLPGDRSHRDERFPMLLNAAASDDRCLLPPSDPNRKCMAFAPYYELEADQNPDWRDIRRHLGYLSAQYIGHPNYLRRCDEFARCRPVIFVFHNAEAEPCDGPNAFDGMVERWKQANTQTSRPSSAGIISAQFHIVFKVFGADSQGRDWQACATHFNLDPRLYSWHQYGPASRAQHRAPEYYTISPGFWHWNEAAPRDNLPTGPGPEDSTRDLVQWRQNIRDMLAANAKWKLVTTYNEWQEGTGVEANTRYGSVFLDALANDGVDPGLAGKVMGAGDIACRGTDPDNNGVPNAEPTATDTTCRMRATSDQIITELGASPNPASNAVLALGDSQYEDGESENYELSYNPTWGRLISITRPALGNHEYNNNTDCAPSNLSPPCTGGFEFAGGSNEDGDSIRGDGYFSFFTGTGTFAGDPRAPLPAPGPRRNPDGTIAAGQAEGVYPFTIGSWLFVPINTNCSQTGTGSGGCGVSSNQYDRLEEWMDAHRAAGANCEVLYSHHPVYSDGEHGSGSVPGAGGDGDDHEYDALWDLFQQKGGELFIAGHDHNYQRFPMMDSNDNIAPEFGVRQMVVGTGGRNIRDVDPSDTTNTVQDPDPEFYLDDGSGTTTDFGVFKMDLRPKDATFTFLNEGGGTGDTFNTTCHN